MQQNSLRPWPYVPNQVTVSVHRGAELFPEETTDSVVAISPRLLVIGQNIPLRKDPELLAPDLVFANHLGQPLGKDPWSIPTSGGRKEYGGLRVDQDGG